MLSPDSRALLLDALRPPAGYSLHRAVATTFTLDLTTALTVPLAFAGYRFQAEPDPIEVMQSLREIGSRFDLFCPGRRNSLRRVALRSRGTARGRYSRDAETAARPRLPSEGVGAAIRQRVRGADVSAARAFAEPHRSSQLGHDALARRAGRAAADRPEPPTRAIRCCTTGSGDHAGTARTSGCNRRACSGSPPRRVGASGGRPGSALPSNRSSGAASPRPEARPWRLPQVGRISVRSRGRAEASL